MSEEIKQVSHQLGALTACVSNLEKQITSVSGKLDRVYDQVIITNESTKSAHKRIDTQVKDQDETTDEHKALKKVVDGHENIKWAGVGIFSFVSFSLGLLGSFVKYIFTGTS